MSLLKDTSLEVFTMHDNNVPALARAWRGNRGAGAYSLVAEPLRTPLADFFGILLDGSI